MSASSNSSPDESDQLFLRWSDDPGLPSHEESVQMLEAKASEYVLRTSFKVKEKTRVYLIGKFTSEAGVVRSCRKAGKNYTLTIGISPDGPTPPHFDIDPGVFIVDSFLTEEQERQILSELEDELRCADDDPSTSPFRAQCSGTACYDGSASVSRLLKTTARSSTTFVYNGVFHFLDKFRQITGTACPTMSKELPACLCGAAVSTEPFLPVANHSRCSSCSN